MAVPTALFQQLRRGLVPHMGRNGGQGNGEYTHGGVFSMPSANLYTIYIQCMLGSPCWEQDRKMLSEGIAAHKWQRHYLARNTGVIRTHDNEIGGDVQALRLHIGTRCGDTNHCGSNADTLHAYDHTVARTANIVKPQAACCPPSQNTNKLLGCTLRGSYGT